MSGEKSSLWYGIVVIVQSQYRKSENTKRHHNFLTLTNLIKYNISALITLKSLHRIRTFLSFLKNINENKSYTFLRLEKKPFKVIYINKYF